jgi:hypothetical protein
VAEPTPLVWLVRLAGLVTVGWGAALHAIGAGRSILPASVGAAASLLAAWLVTLRVVDSGPHSGYGFDVSLGLLLVVPMWAVLAGLLWAGAVAAWLVRRGQKWHGSQG